MGSYVGRQDRQTRRPASSRQTHQRPVVMEVDDEGPGEILRALVEPQEDDRWTEMLWFLHPGKGVKTSVETARPHLWEKMLEADEQQLQFEDISHKEVIIITPNSERKMFSKESAWLQVINGEEPFLWDERIAEFGNDNAIEQYKDAIAQTLAITNKQILVANEGQPGIVAWEGQNYRHCILMMLEPGFHDIFSFEAIGRTTEEVHALLAPFGHESVSVLKLRRAAEYRIDSQAFQTLVLAAVTDPHASRDENDVAVVVATTANDTGVWINLPRDDQEEFPTREQYVSHGMVTALDLGPPATHTTRDAFVNFHNEDNRRCQLAFHTAIHMGAGRKVCKIAYIKIARLTLSFADVTA